MNDYTKNRWTELAFKVGIVLFIFAIIRSYIDIDPVHMIVAGIIFSVDFFLRSFSDKSHMQEFEELKSKHKSEKKIITNSFPTFVGNFNEFCDESKKAIVNAPNNSEIFTIQTPLIPDAITNGNVHFKNYIDHIVKSIFTQNANGLDSKIPVFQRLIVINNKNDPDEIKQEEKKLEVFCDSVYKEIAKTRTWEPTLQNIEIGIVDGKMITGSPLSHLDILLIKNTHLVIAFSKEKGKGYEWGSSIHFENNAYNKRFVEQIPVFKSLYKNAWDNKAVKKINFGTIHVPGNLKDSKDKINAKIINILNSL